jgi:hypothetical protein
MYPHQRQVVQPRAYQARSREQGARSAKREDPEVGLWKGAMAGLLCHYGRPGLGWRLRGPKANSVDGDDAPHYLEKQVRTALDQVKP